MPIIDCHAHVFPDPAYQAGRVLDGMAQLAANLVSEDTRAKLGSFSGLLKGINFQVPWPQMPSRANSMLSVEKIAESRQKTSKFGQMMLDGVGAMVGAPQVLIQGTVSHLLASMDAAGIERSIVIAANLTAPNQWLLHQAVAQAPGRLIPVAIVPELSGSATDEQWQAAYYELAQAGVRGFKIHLNMDGLPPTHSAYRAAFSVAAQRNLFIIMHTGHFQVPGYKQTGPVHPSALSHLFEDHPSVRVCLAHMNRDQPTEAWEMMRRFPQLFTDTSWQPAPMVRAAIKEVGVDRLLLGSDWPLLHAKMQQESLDILRQSVAPEEFVKISEENPCRFIG